VFKEKLQTLVRKKERKYKREREVNERKIEKRKKREKSDDGKGKYKKTLFLDLNQISITFYLL